MQRLRRDTDHPYTQPCVCKRLVQVRPLERGHATIFPGLSVEHHVRRHNCSAHDGGAVEESLAEGAGCGGNGGLAGGLVGAAECMAGFGEGGDWRGGFEGGGSGGRVEGSRCEGGGFGELFDGCGEGEGTTEDEGHVCTDLVSIYKESDVRSTIADN